MWRYICPFGWKEEKKIFLSALCSSSAVESGREKDWRWCWLCFLAECKALILCSVVIPLKISGSSWPNNSLGYVKMLVLVALDRV